MQEHHVDRGIPRTIVQVFLGKALPEPLKRNGEYLTALNPGWTLELYDDDRVVSYIREHFGSDVERSYLAIAPAYGAARADFFRYLRIYAGGGVYLDAKSSLSRPLDEILEPDEAFLLCQWANRPGEAREGFGSHAELKGVVGGEFQQWHVIARPGHPFLAAVIERVLGNIRSYSPWRLGVGGNGVWRTTGPIAYTRAIAPILANHPHRLVRDETSVGLLYSIGSGYVHQDHFRNHYTVLGSAIVPAHGLRQLTDPPYLAARALKKRVQANGSA